MKEVYKGEMIDLVGVSCDLRSMQYYITAESNLFNYRSHRRVDCVRKVNRASQFKARDSVKMRERCSELGRDPKYIWKDFEGMKEKFLK